ncbi:hypothetical protein C8J57DRAFT_1649383, partial [Mycena rebaudengoi]
MASLPQELVNSVVNQLDDYSSLTSCALVSTSFVAPAQKATFKSLCTHTELSHGHPTILAASDSLAAFPHLATYIRLLKIDLSHLEHEVQALESILLVVRTLERLIICGRRKRWDSIAPTLKIVIENKYHHAMGYIQSLYLIFHLISFTARLEEREPVEPAPGLAFDVRLTHLALSDSGWGTKALCNLLVSSAPSRTARLERLSIVVDQASRRYDSEPLSTIAPSLRHLSLGIGTIPQPDFKSIRESTGYSARSKADGILTAVSGCPKTASKESVGILSEKRTKERVQIIAEETLMMGTGVWIEIRECRPELTAVLGRI